jgi:CHAT domain-containing protein
MKRTTKNTKKRGRVYLGFLLVSCFICGLVLPSLANSGYYIGENVTGLCRSPQPPDALGANSMSCITQTQLVSSKQISQVDAGKILYDAGRFSEAVQVLQQAVQGYQQLGDVLKQAATLGNLSLAYQQMGNWEQAKKALTLSFRLQGIQQTIEENNIKKLPVFSQNLLAQTLVIQGRLLFSTGQTQTALQTWQLAEKVFTQAGNTNGSLKAIINQAQSLQILGFYQNAVKLLKQVNVALSSQSDSVEKLASLRSLGDVLELVGDVDESHAVLLQSLKIAKSLGNNTEVGLCLLSLGNTLAARQSQQAINYYQQAVNISPSPQIKAQALLNHLDILVDANNYKDATALIPVIETQLEKLPPSRAAIYARINFAQSLTKIPSNNVQRASGLIATAIQIARNINDQHAYAHSLSQLALLYEKTKQYSFSQQLAQKALVIAQVENATEITYQLQWQLGRLLRAQKDINGAIKFYDAAIDTLATLRSDLVSVNQDVQFSFKESVEPVYRESVALLLSQGRQDAKILDKARQRIEALQLAELDNFFREACLIGTKVILDQVVDRDNPNTAILYPIILDSALQVIVKIPNQQLKLYTTEIAQAEVEATVNQLRLDLIDPTAIGSLKIHSQKLYRWLFQQIEPDLAKSGVNILVFIPDTVLRIIPLSALFDGESFLLEKYAVAMTTGLQLLNPQPLQTQKLNALTAGLTQAPLPYKFDILPGVKSELQQISQAGIKTTTLLDLAFTSQALEHQVNNVPFNVVHLATHGKFSSRAEDTYILAADGPINVRQLDSLLRSRDTTQKKALELLVLSACQTAKGDKRAALGLAGVAIKAGARSTIASLWQIDDESTAMFVGNFYRELKAKVSKAQALRLAQLKLLNHPNYRAPIYWAAYVLVGNWL